MAKQGSILFISDWGRHSIISYNTDSREETVLMSDVQEPMGLFVSPVSVQLQGKNL